MLDERLLEYWKSHQMHRFEMANNYNCSCFYDGLSITHGSLTFITNGEHLIKVQKYYAAITVPLSDISGYSQEGSNIIITLRPEAGPPLYIEFQSPHTQAAAFMHLKNFAREIVESNTLPSSDSSSSAD